MLETGSRLGPYEIVAPIGAGGMGEVFRARDTRLDRSVAIKVVSQEFAARFEREARAISALNHPHICTLYDVGRENGTDYLVMELLEGESLADRLLRGPLPLDGVVRYGAQIAAALDRAHKAGVIHRDLKPGNIMLTKSGAKLLDFGLAKNAAISLAGTPSEATAATEHKPLTREGTILGTFQYMSPEQLEGVEADSRTDIFALGCVLYEMATGRRAFEGKTRTSLIAAIVGSEPTPVAQLQPLTPPALEHVIERCLRKDPDLRWQSAHDVAEELKWIGEAGSQAGVPVPLMARRSSRERLLWLAALIAAVAVTTGIVVKLRPREERISYRFLLPQQDAGYTRATWPLLSPDGTRVILYATAAGQRRIFVRRLDDFSFTSFPRPEGLTGAAFWSHDSRELAGSIRGRTLVRMNVADGTVQTIAEVPGFQNGAWGPDGTILLGNNDGPLMMLRATGGAPKAITTPDRSKFELGHHAPIFLPGGKRFLFISFTRNPSKPDSPHSLYVGELGSTEVRKIGEVTSKVDYARGFLFYVRGGSLVAVPFDAKNAEITGAPVTVANDVGFFQPTGAGSFSVADDGTVAWMPRPQGNQLVIADAGGSTLRTIGEKGDLRGARLTPDGARVIVGRRDLATGTFDVWMYGLTRPTATRMTFEPAEERAPVMSRDGTTLYYGTDRKGVPDIYAKTIDSAEEDRAVVEAPGDQTPSDVSPDGKYLVYTDVRAESKTRADEMALSLQDGRVFPLVRTPGNDGNGRISPDGKWLLYLSDVSGAIEVYVKPFLRNGPARQISAGGVTVICWNRDSRAIYYSAENARTMMRADIDAEGNPSEPRPLFTLREEIIAFEPLPDGGFVLNLLDEAGGSPPGRVIVRWPDSLRQGD